MLIYVTKQIYINIIMVIYVTKQIYSNIIMLIYVTKQIYIPWYGTSYIFLFYNVNQILFLQKNLTIQYK